MHAQQAVKGISVVVAQYNEKACLFLENVINFIEALFLTLISCQHRGHLTFQYLVVVLASVSQASACSEERVHSLTERPLSRLAPSADKKCYYFKN